MKSQEADKRLLEVVIDHLLDPEWVYGVAMDGYDHKYFTKFRKASGRLASRLAKVLVRTNAKLEQLNADRGE